MKQTKLYIKNRDKQKFNDYDIYEMLLLFMISYYKDINPPVLSFNQSYQIMIEMAAVIKHFVEVIEKSKANSQLIQTNQQPIF